MKILTVGCLHGDLKQAQRLAETAVKENVDIVVFAGDFTLGEQHTPGLFKVFKDKGLQLALLPGNHESPNFAEAIAKQYGARFLHGHYAWLGKYKEVGLFGAGLANFGLWQLGEDEIYNLLKQGHERISDAKKKIMLTHVHPDGTVIDFDGRFFGSTGVRNAIEAFKPDFAISSNIHEAEGLEDSIGTTKVISVGRHGKIIEI